MFPAQNKGLKFITGIAAGFLAPTLGSDGIKYCNLAPQTNDKVDRFLKYASTIGTSAAIFHSVNTNEIKIYDAFTKQLNYRALGSIFDNSHREYRYSDDSIPAIITNQLLTITGAGIGTFLVGAPILTKLSNAMPSLAARLDIDLDTLPIIYREPARLLPIALPLSVIAASTFASYEALNQDLGESIESSINITVDNACVTLADALQPKLTLHGTLLSIALSRIPINNSVLRGFAIGNTAYLLRQLFMQRESLSDASPFIKLAALIGGGTLLARIGWLGYSQYRSA